MQDVSDFVCGVFVASLTEKGRDIWMATADARLEHYEQSVELLLLDGDESSRVYYFGDHQEQFERQIDLIASRILPMVARLADQSEYLALLVEARSPSSGLGTTR